MKRAVFLAALALAMPVAAQADDHPPRVYHGRTYYWSCRHSAGTAGLIGGGVAGAVIGGSVIGGGLAGPIIGGVAGALGGRAIDRTITKKKRCGYYR